MVETETTDDVRHIWMWFNTTRADHDVTLVDKTCVRCKGTTTIVMRSSEYERWSKGELIQNVVPEAPTWARELLISGIHRECWREMFGGDG